MYHPIYFANWLQQILGEQVSIETTIQFGGGTGDGGGGGSGGGRRGCDGIDGPLEALGYVIQ